MFDKIDNYFDIVLPFQLEHSSIRGRLIRLDKAMWEIIEKHNYPDVVNDYMAQATALSLSIVNCFKFEGLFTLQINGDGPLRLLIVNVNAEGHMRACARFDERALENLSQEEQKKIYHVFGQGHMVFTLDPEGPDEMYQGIVELTGSSLAESVNHFFRQSEQLETGVVVAQGRNKESLAAAALMIQRLPVTAPMGSAEREQQDDTWIHALSVTGSVTKKELLDRNLSNYELLYRLFWEHRTIIYAGKPYKAQCRCSEGRIFDMLEAFSAEEREDMVIEEKISVTCEFCGKSYDFTRDSFS